MKTIKKDDFNGLVIELQIIAGKKFTGDQFDRLSEGFSKIAWSEACRIVRDFERQERFPSNIYGVIANRIEDQFREEIKKSYQRQRWEVAAADRATAEEFRLWIEVIDEALIWVKTGISSYRQQFERITLPPPEGHKGQSWSEVVDFVLEKWGEFQKLNPNSSDREEFLRQALRVLHEEREKRLSGKFAVQS